MNIAQPTLALTPPKRRMPTLLAIAEHWEDRPDWRDYPGNIDIGEPFCAACGWRVPVPWGQDLDLAAMWGWAGKWIDRAHLVDHMADGSDDVSNLVPLCHLCHRTMPMFRVGQSAAALDWVRSHQRRSGFWTLYTDGYGERFPAEVAGMSGSASRAWLRHMWVEFLELYARSMEAAARAAERRVREAAA